MDRLITRRGVLIGAGAAATLALTDTSAEESIDADRIVVEPSPIQNRIALTAFGSLELPSAYLGNNRAMARSRDINCQLYISTNGTLFVDDLHYERERAVVRLTQEQHLALLDAFARIAEPGVIEVPYYEPVQPKRGRS